MADRPSLPTPFGVALVAFGKYLARDEPVFLFALVRRVLDVGGT
jgi:hypothetical protein